MATLGHKIAPVRFELPRISQPPMGMIGHYAGQLVGGGGEHQKKRQHHHERQQFLAARHLAFLTGLLEFVGGRLFAFVLLVVAHGAPSGKALKRRACSNSNGMRCTISGSDSSRTSTPSPSLTGSARKYTFACGIERAIRAKAVSVSHSATMTGTTIMKARRNCWVITCANETDSTASDT